MIISSGSSARTKKKTIGDHSEENVPSSSYHWKEIIEREGKEKDSPVVLSSKEKGITQLICNFQGPHFLETEEELISVFFVTFVTSGRANIVERSSLFFFFR